MFDASNLYDFPVTCPYDPNHKIAKSRIQRHLIRCEKNYPEDYKLLCPYNATHRLFKFEMAEHLQTCNSRQLLEPELCRSTVKKGSIKNYSCSEISSTIENAENWDEDNKINDFDSYISEEFEINYPLQSDTNQAESKWEIIGENDKLPPPRSNSEAAMMEMDDASAEEVESVFSSMGIRQGSIQAKDLHFIKLVGYGRGQPLKKD
ncbi:gametocyte-specific factor 1-like [Prorops nasuta]|uniref:gametocyte-specific factor 1-like n=1 Tax=Prorops nasuta TaxID=863751 RepID=UPI0034CE914E